LEGRRDPYWTKSMNDEVYGPDPKESDRKERATRFLQMLVTIDGIFAQIYLADPMSRWTWSVFDRFVLRHLSLLIGDEFLDSVVKTTGVDTHYSSLKRYRGELKEAVVTNKPLPLPSRAIAQAFRPVVEFLNSKKERTPEWLQSASILIQSRGCGTPPPIVVLQSKEKFLKTVSEEPPQMTSARASLIRGLIQEELNLIPDHVFTGLTTKAAVHITGAACFEEGRGTGGTLEYVRSIVSEGRLGRSIRIIDLLDPDSPPLYKKIDEVTEGEYIFWRSLEEVLGTPPEVLREASMVMIREPGKARTVTKARGALKVVLDLVNTICSHPLKKGVSSSESGMGKSHHGWNFFKSFYSSWEKETFRVKRRNRFDQTNGSFSETVEYDDVYVGFTDYEEATDHLEHSVAWLISERWMSKCGIPPLLQGIVRETCYKPRMIYFSASGALSGYGEEVEGETRRIRLVRGVLMGDPLTKVVLHLINIGVRRLSKLGVESSVLMSMPNYMRSMSVLKKAF